MDVCSCLLNLYTVVHHLRIFETALTSVKVPHVIDGVVCSGPNAFSLPTSARPYIISVSLRRGVSNARSGSSCLAAVSIELYRVLREEAPSQSISLNLLHASAIFKGKLCLARPTHPNQYGD